MKEDPLVQFQRFLTYKGHRRQPATRSWFDTFNFLWHQDAEGNYLAAMVQEAEIFFITTNRNYIAEAITSNAEMFMALKEMKDRYSKEYR